MATISAATYNAIQKKAAAVLGAGGTNPSTNVADSKFGYGQSVTSSQVQAGTVTRASTWINLRTDLVKARTHQIGAVGTGTAGGAAWANLRTISAGSVISQAIVTQLTGVADACVTDRLTAFNTQLGSATATSTRSTTWGTGVPTITHSFRVTFSDATQARYYFNSGGTIKYSASLTGGGLISNVTKYNAWVNSLSGLGTLTMAVSSSATSFGTFTVTKSGASGTVTDRTLSAVDQIIYTNTQSSPYANNTVTVNAKYISSLAVIEITVALTDGAPQAATGIGPVVDELIDGTLTSTGTITPITGAFSITPTIANQLTL
jgi:hypothetical protein